MEIGRITRVPLREVWKHEAANFTTWLAANVDVLSEFLNIDLEAPEIEQEAGDFYVDMVTKTRDGKVVIIENQLERSDHDHLGKLLTYSAAFAADIAIWIVGDARSEHAQAVAWLNQTSSTHYYLLQAQAIRIGDSPAALNLVRIIAPSELSDSVSETKHAIAARHAERHSFWLALKALADKLTQLHARVTPGDDNWLSASAAVAGFFWNYRVRQSEWEVLVEIDSSSKAWNKAAFNCLLRSRQEVEARFGHPLRWEEKPNTNHSEVVFGPLPGGYRSPSADWPKIHSSMIDAMMRLERAIASEFVAAAKAGDAAATQ